MNYRVVLLNRAERQADIITESLAKRSPQGARHWLEALGKALDELSFQPQRFGLAPENGCADYKLRQLLFKTRSGRKYRAVFTIISDEVRVLHVRGPGQRPLTAADF